MSKSKSKSLIKDKWTTLEIDKDGNFERVLIVSTKVVLDPNDDDHSSTKRLAPRAQTLRRLSQMICCSVIRWPESSASLMKGTGRAAAGDGGRDFFGALAVSFERGEKFAKF